jgi:putative acetyltransferase
MHIREEKPEDYAAMDDLLRVAFTFDNTSTLDEPEMVRELRAAEDIALSLVAVSSGDELIGHILFSPVNVENNSGSWVALGLIAVEPRLQRRGVGRALMEEGLRRVREAGAAGCVVMAEPPFYQRFGFRKRTGVQPSIPLSDEFLVLPFGDEIPQGLVTYPPAYHRD